MTTTHNRATSFEMGRVVSRTFGALGRNIVTFLVLAVVIVGIPTLVLTWLSLQLNPITSPLTTPAMPPNAMARSFAGLPIALAKWVLTSILTGAVVQGVVSDLNGTRPTLGECFATGLRFILPVTGVSILFGLGIGLGAIFLIVPGLIVLTMWCVAIPAVVLEKTGVFGAFSRSRILTKGHRWTLFGLMFLFWLVVMTFNVTLLALSGGLPWGNPQFATRLTSVMLTGTAVGVASNLVGTAGIAAIYYELRSIKDGVAPSALAAVFD